MLEYHLQIPSSGASGAPILVSVHGISGNASEHARRFAAVADEYGVVLVAPYFSPDAFRRYQRLGRADRTTRADLALQDTINEVAANTGARADRIYLFGY